MVVSRAADMRNDILEDAEECFVLEGPPWASKKLGPVVLTAKLRKLAFAPKGFLDEP